jgi:hypothetical protein
LVHNGVRLSFGDDFRQMFSIHVQRFICFANVMPSPAAKMIWYQRPAASADCSEWRASREFNRPKPQSKSRRPIDTVSNGRRLGRLMSV